ncbi:olfactory receptor class A-like protein 4 isoform 4-T4 [Spinachia spinachia]
MSEVLTIDAILFGLLVFSGILGNLLVIHVVFQSAFESPSRRLPPSDTILVHLSLANLLTSVFRTVPIFVSDLGLDVSLSPGWCRIFMLLWVWWRAVGCWVTLALSIFHCTILRRHHMASGPLAQERERRHVWIALGLVWGTNLAFSIPALVFSTHVHGNATVELMVISCTTRPLLGCVWEFPSEQQGSAFASASLALNEVLPLVLMVCTNMATLHALAKHIRAVAAGGHSGDTQKVAAVTYYNHNGGDHAEGLLTVSHFSASLFVGFSPMVVALGHGKLRRRIMSRILMWSKVYKCRKENTEEPVKSPKTKGKRGKRSVFIVQEKRTS